MTDSDQNEAVQCLVLGDDGNHSQLANKNLAQITHYYIARTGQTRKMNFDDDVNYEFNGDDHHNHGEGSIKT